MGKEWNRKKVVKTPCQQKGTIKRQEKQQNQHYCPFGSFYETEFFTISWHTEWSKVRFLTIFFLHKMQYLISRLFQNQCFYLIIEHISLENLNKGYTQSILVVILSILEVPKIISIGKKCGILKFTIHTFNMGSVYILSSSENCECALYSHEGKTKTNKYQHCFFLKNTPN